MFADLVTSKGGVSRGDGVFDLRPKVFDFSSSCVFISFFEAFCDELEDVLAFELSGGEFDLLEVLEAFFQEFEVADVGFPLEFGY